MLRDDTSARCYGGGKIAMGILFAGKRSIVAEEDLCPETALLSSLATNNESGTRESLESA